MFFFRFLADRA